MNFKFDDEIFIRNQKKIYAIYKSVIISEHFVSESPNFNYFWAHSLAQIFHANQSLLSQRFRIWHTLLEISSTSAKLYESYYYAGPVRTVKQVRHCLTALECYFGFLKPRTRTAHRSAKGARAVCSRQTHGHNFIIYKFSNRYGSVPDFIEKYFINLLNYGYCISNCAFIVFFCCNGRTAISILNY